MCLDATVMVAVMLWQGCKVVEDGEKDEQQRGGREGSTVAHMGEERSRGRLGCSARVCRVVVRGEGDDDNI